MTEKYPAMDVDIIVNGLCKSLIIELSSYFKRLIELGNFSFSHFWLDRPFC